MHLRLFIINTIPSEKKSQRSF